MEKSRLLKIVSILLLVTSIGISQAEDLSEKLDKTTKKLRDAIDNSLSKSSASRKSNNKFGQRGRLEDEIARVRDKHGKQVGQRIQSFEKRYNARATSSIVKIYDKYGKDSGVAIEKSVKRLGTRILVEAERDLDEVIPKISRFARDPETQEALYTAAATAIHYQNLAEDYKSTAKYGAVDGLRYLAKNMYIENSTGQTVTIESYAQDWIGKSIPPLKNTSIHDDPVGSIVYLLVYKDTDYMVNELRVIPTKSNKHVSLSDAILHSSPSSPANALNVLETIGALEVLKKSIGNGEDSSSKAMDLMRQIERGAN